jgi:hypothetical protein
MIVRVSWWPVYLQNVGFEVGHEVGLVLFEDDLFEEINLFELPQNPFDFELLGQSLLRLNEQLLLPRKLEETFFAELSECIEQCEQVAILF